MPRYILIDNCSGYIFGDTVDMPGDHVIDGRTMREWGDDATPIMAAQWLDEAVVGEFGQRYTEVSERDLASNESGYHVYRADINGSDAIVPIRDGQNQDEIDDVIQNCRYVTTIKSHDAEAR